VLKKVLMGKILTMHNMPISHLINHKSPAISASASGVIVVQGGTKTSANTIFPTEISVGVIAEVGTPSPGDYDSMDGAYDSTNNKVVLAWDDAGAAQGYAVVGTVSGTTISYGSPTSYTGANDSSSTWIVYDSTNDRMVVTYIDDDNSNYLTLVVGTVSGTSISFGTPVVAESSNSASCSSTFDINAGKVLTVWKSNVDTYWYGIVGTVSGTSISFGTKVSPASIAYGGGNGYVGYDVNAQKSLFVAATSTNGDAYVASISGTVLSWGAVNDFTTTVQYSHLKPIYDANAQKFVVLGSNDTASSYDAFVATISGTTNSFGTAVVIDSNSTGRSLGCYDSDGQEVIAVGITSNTLYGYVGTVSGTTTSWTAGSTLVENADYGYGVGMPTYDVNADKTVFMWSNQGDTAVDSRVGTVGTGTFTIGSNYYVQPDGSYDTSAGSPSVKAGLAISTTSLLLSGDS